MQRSSSGLEYATKKRVTRRNASWASIEAVTPWSTLLAELEPFYPKGEGRGRPPINLERMLRMCIVQQYFELSEEATEDTICDSQAIRGFVGIDLSGKRYRMRPRYSSSGACWKRTNSPNAIA